MYYSEIIYYCSLKNDNSVDGGWTSWSSWSACSVSCSEGISKRSRSCTNPSPQYGGDNCVGDGMEIIVCRLQYCPGIACHIKRKDFVILWIS